MWQLVVLCNKILIKVSQLNFTEMKKNIFVISTIFLGIALLFTIATLQSENSDLRNVVRNQANQMIDTTTMLQLEVCMLKHWIEVIQKSK